MPAGTLKAHYDGERIVLDGPFEIPPNSPLMVTVLTASEAVVGEDWILAARKALSSVYGPQQPEHGVESSINIWASPKSLSQDLSITYCFVSNFTAE